MLSKDIEQIFKGYANDGKLGGVYMATPTGKVLEEDSTYIEVLIYGKSYFAKPCMAFGSYNVPDETWLKKYKDEIMVWVAFENGNPAHPVYLGVTPRDEKAPKKNFPEIKTYKTTEFKYSFDDKEKLFNFSKINQQGEETHKIEVSEDGLIITDTKNNRLKFNFQTSKIELVNSKNNGIIIDNFTILGKGSGSSSAVLGETMIALMGQTMTAISGAISTLASASVIVNPTTMIGIFNPGVITALTNTVSTLGQIQGQLMTALSKNVKLD